jgi:chromosome partitioning protein
MSSKILVISQQKGGVGKSTIASNIAVAYQMKGLRVLLIDIDPQRSTERWYNLRCEKKGLEFTGIKMISSMAWKVRNEIDIYRNRFDVIIIDSPPHVQVDLNNILRIADLVILPIQPSLFDIWAIEQPIEICEKESIDYKILLNRVPSSKKDLQDIFNKFPGKFFDNYIGNRVAFASAINSGLGVVEMDAKSTGSIEISNLVSEISEVIKLEDLLLC